MPRRSDVPRSESETFFRVNAPPRDEDLYRRRRLEIHPETRTGVHPVATREAHREYTDWKFHCDRAQRAYTEASAEEEERVKGMSQIQKRYYETTSEGVLPTGHSRLEPLARRVGDSELSQARSRREAFERHEFMYPSIASKKKHFDHVRNHFDDSADGYDNVDWHVRLKSARPSSTHRDLYDNEPTRDYSPHREPYPPQFPPPRRYSTVRGDDEESSGGEWSSVKKPSRPSTSARHAARRGR